MSNFAPFCWIHAFHVVPVIFLKLMDRAPEDSYSSLHYSELRLCLSGKSKKLNTIQMLLGNQWRAFPKMEPMAGIHTAVAVYCYFLFHFVELSNAFYQTFREETWMNRCQHVVRRFRETMKKAEEILHQPEPKGKWVPIDGFLCSIYKFIPYGFGKDVFFLTKRIGHWSQQKQLNSQTTQPFLDSLFWGYPKTTWPTWPTWPTSSLQFRNESFEKRSCAVPLTDTALVAQFLTSMLRSRSIRTDLFPRMFRWFFAVVQEGFQDAKFKFKTFVWRLMIWNLVDFLLFFWDCFWEISVWYYSSFLKDVLFPFLFWYLLDAE